MRVYLDVCCLNRPFDDQSQDRIRLETEAILLIVGHLRSAEWDWVGSDILNLEIEQTPDPQRRFRVGVLASFVHTSVRVGEDEVVRALELEGLGFRGFDALHLACAESAAVDIFLTTDNQLLRHAARQGSKLRLRVENPLTWLEEVTGK